MKSFTSLFGKGVSLLSFIALTAVFSIGLQACGGSSSSGGLAANPSGYYTGSAAIKSPLDGVTDIVLSDVKAMINGNRIMIMSESTPLLYDGTITDITGNDFTADVTIYHGQDLENIGSTHPTPIQTTVSGTITEGSKITGTVAGTGIGSGTFELNFSLTNSTLASSDNITKTWTGNVNTVAQTSFDFNIDASGNVNVEFLTQPNNGLYYFCLMTGSIKPVAESTIYSVDLTLTDCGVGANNGQQTGFATTTDSNHDTLVIAFSNGNYSFTAELTPK